MPISKTRTSQIPGHAFYIEPPLLSQNHLHPYSLSFNFLKMEHRKSLLASPFSFLSLIFITLFLGEKALAADVGPVVEREQRRTLTVSEYGKITAVNITDGLKSSPHHLQFFTLEPNSLFLPVLLHADMVFYVHTGTFMISSVSPISKT